MNAYFVIILYNLHIFYFLHYLMLIKYCITILSNLHVLI